MSYVLYGDPGSGSATVELALAELGEAVDLVDISLDRDAQRGDDYAAINAQRKLPALVTPDGETLTESLAILLTLAERHPESVLLPHAPRERAQALRWLQFMASELYPVIEIIDYPERFQPELDATPEARRDEIRRGVREIWKRRWLLVEQAAGGAPWFLPDGFCLVDIYAAVMSRWAQVAEWREQNLPHVEGIAAAVAKRPGLESVWQRHFG